MDIIDGAAPVQPAEPDPIAMRREPSVIDWRRCWHPVAIADDLPAARPYPFSLYAEPFVLFRDSAGKLGCLADQCPHRAARLSDGRITAEGVECLYHGWRFGTDGRCRHIPQLPPRATIPDEACARALAVEERQGVIWVWPGAPEEADAGAIPTLADLEAPGTHRTDYVRDLPYDQTYYIENVIDPAHVHITHHDIIGDRAFARPIEMEIVEVSQRGISGWGKGMGPDSEAWGKMDFIAPNIVVYAFRSPDGARVGGTVLYSVPLADDRCRILLRNYSNAPRSWRARLTPRWWQHITVRNAVLETDMQLIMGQKAAALRQGGPLRDAYLPLASCDRFVVEYRKWLDRFGAGLPFYQGYATARAPAAVVASAPPPLDRLSQHTQLCTACGRAYDRLCVVRRVSVLAAPLLLAAGLLVSLPEPRLAAGMLAGAATVAAGFSHWLIGHLE